MSYDIYFFRAYSLSNAFVNLSEFLCVQAHFVVANCTVLKISVIFLPLHAVEF